MMTEILIFKTGVHTEALMQQVAVLLGSVAAIKQWSFDLEDCDRVLRVVASDLRPDAVEQLLERAGVSCERMEYEV